jgi:hypothetical protein
MFTQAGRYSFKDAAAEQKASDIYNRAKAMWTGAGAVAMQRYRIVDGEQQGQHMVVVRFNNQQDWQKARDGNAELREQITSDLAHAGIELEEMLLLDEVS